MNSEILVLIGTIAGSVASGVWSLIREGFRKDRDMALINQRLDFLAVQVGQVQSQQQELKKDLDAAFARIRGRGEERP